MVVDWISLLFVAAVLLPVNGDCPPSRAESFTAYPMKFDIAIERTYDLFKGGFQYKEDFLRFFRLNHSLISPDDADRVRYCLSFNRLTLLTLNGSLMIDDKSVNYSSTYHHNGNMTFHIHRSLPLHYMKHGDDSKWHTSKDAALDLIFCGNGNGINSFMVAYINVTIPEEGEYGELGGDHHIDPFDHQSVNHTYTDDLACCKLEVKLALHLLESFVHANYAMTYMMTHHLWLASLVLLAFPVIVIMTTIAILRIDRRQEVPTNGVTNLVRRHQRLFDTPGDEAYDQMEMRPQPGPPDEDDDDIEDRD